MTVGQPLPTNRRELARAVPSQAKDRQTGTYSETDGLPAPRSAFAC